MDHHIGRNRMRQIESLTFEIDRLRNAAAGLAADIERVEGLLRRFTRDRRHGVTRDMLNVLRTANQPLGLREIAIRVLAQNGMDVEDRKATVELMEQMRVALTRYAAAGIVRREAAPGWRMLWSVAN